MTFKGQISSRQDSNFENLYYRMGLFSGLLKVTGSTFGMNSCKFSVMAAILTTLEFSKLHISCISQRARKFLKVKAKKLVKSNKSNIFSWKNAFLAVLKTVSPSSKKLIFGHFWNYKKWNLVKKNFVQLIYWNSPWVFLASTFFNL